MYLLCPEEVIHTGYCLSYLFSGHQFMDPTYWHLGSKRKTNDSSGEAGAFLPSKMALWTIDAIALSINSEDDTASSQLVKQVHDLLQNTMMLSNWDL